VQTIGFGKPGRVPKPLLGLTMNLNLGGEFTIMDWCLLETLGVPNMSFSVGNYDFYIYCAIQATTLLITYFLRKKGILPSGFPHMQYVLALIIGHLVYLVKAWIVLIIFISCWPVIYILDGYFDVLYFYCAIQVIALLLTYFLRKKGMIMSGSPLLGFIIGHLIYVAICVCLLAWSLSNLPF